MIRNSFHRIGPNERRAPRRRWVRTSNPCRWLPLLPRLPRRSGAPNRDRARPPEPHCVEKWWRPRLLHVHALRRCRIESGSADGPRWSAPARRDKTRRSNPATLGPWRGHHRRERHFHLRESNPIYRCATLPGKSRQCRPESSDRPCPPSSCAPIAAGRKPRWQGPPPRLQQRAKAQDVHWAGMPVPPAARRGKPITRRRRRQRRRGTGAQNSP